MMILYSSTASPFGRKIKLAAHVLGLIDEISVRPTDTMNPEDEIRTVNPLGKIPSLVVEETALYDSRVIMEYLDSCAGGGRIIPAAGIERYACLTAAAKMDGIIDAAILIVYEGRFRPAEMQVERFVEWQRDKIIRGLQSIDPAPYSGGSMPDVADLGLGCALDYLDFRKPLSWRDHAPALADWQAGFAASVAGYAETMPVDSRKVPSQ